MLNERDTILISCQLLRGDLQHLLRVINAHDFSLKRWLMKNCEWEPAGASANIQDQRRGLCLKQGNQRMTNKGRLNLLIKAFDAVVSPRNEIVHTSINPQY